MDVYKGTKMIRVRFVRAKGAEFFFAFFFFFFLYRISWMDNRGRKSGANSTPLHVNLTLIAEIRRSKLSFRDKGI